MAYRLLELFLLISALPLAAQIRINAGGSATGLYLADQLYIGGQVYVSPLALPAGGADYLRDERYPATNASSFGYRFPVSDGTYTVVLHFIENSTAVTAPGQRVFSVSINGLPVIPSIDLAAVAPLNTPIDRTFTVAAAAGAGISMIFTTIVRNAVVSAIEVIPAPVNANPFAPCVPLDGGIACPGGFTSGYNSQYVGTLAANGLTYLFPDNSDPTGRFLKIVGLDTCANADPTIKPPCYKTAWAAPPVIGFLPGTTTFTVSASALACYLNGIRLTPNVDYTYDGSTFAPIAGTALAAGGAIICDYTPK